MSIKVALACHNFPPEFMGGTERVVLALAHALQQRGDEVVVICGSECPHDGRDTIEEDIAKNGYANLYWEAQVEDLNIRRDKDVLAGGQHGSGCYSRASGVGGDLRPISPECAMRPQEPSTEPPDCVEQAGWNRSFGNVKFSAGM